jgi:hypothetical protein
MEREVRLFWNDERDTWRAVVSHATEGEVSVSADTPDKALTILARRLGQRGELPLPLPQFPAHKREVLPCSDNVYIGTVPKWSKWIK